jgi:Flp pilus assembly protein TadD
LIGAVCACYGGALRGEFLFDDTATILNNPSITHLWPLIGSGAGAGPLNPPPNRPTSARPIVNLTFAINHAIGSFDTVGYHAVNIGLHAISALLLWAIVWRTLLLDYFGGRFDRIAGGASFAAALVWAVHPLNTESVAYVTQRTESLMGLFYLAVLYASLHYWSATSRASRIGWLLAAGSAGILGMLSKEMMASAIAMVLLFERTFVRGSFVRSLTQSWPLYIALALSWIPVIALYSRQVRTPLAGFDQGIHAPTWWLTQSEVVLWYLKLVFWPWPLVIHYEVPYLRTIDQAWPWLVPVALLIVATVLLVWRRTSLGFVLAWFFAVLSPTLLIPMPGETMAERRMYVPLMAIVPWVVVACYSAVERFLQPAHKVAVAAVVTLVVAGLLGAVTVRRVADYKDELTIWEDAVSNQPNDPLVQVNLGTSLGKVGRTEESKQHFEKALELVPEHSHAHFNLARTLAEEGRFDEAISHYEAAVRTEMGFADAEYNYGLALASVGRTSEAIEHFEAAIKSRPDFAAAHNNLGVTLAGMGRAAEAIPHLKEAARLEPDPESYGNLASACALAGQRADAIAAGEKAIELARQRGKTKLADDLEVWLAGYRVRTGQ